METDTEVEGALARLNAALPLARHQSGLRSSLQGLHRAILRGFARLGRAPEPAELLGTPAPVSAALQQLAALDLVVLGADGALAGAYPFTTEPTIHQVWLDGRELHAMCAVDALAISPMFARPTLIRSRCHSSGQSIELHQDGATVQSSPDDVHVGIGWQTTHGCAARSLCREMVFFASAMEAAAWRKGMEERRTVLDLGQTVALAAAFFLPLLREGTVAEESSS